MRSISSHKRFNGARKLRAARPAASGSLLRVGSTHHAPAARAGVSAAPGLYASSASAADGSAASVRAQPDATAPAASFEPGADTSSTTAPVAPTAESVGDDTAPAHGDTALAAATSGEAMAQAVAAPAEASVSPQPAEAPADSGVATSLAQAADASAPAARSSGRPQQSGGDRAPDPATTTAPAPPDAAAGAPPAAEASAPTQASQVGTHRKAQPHDPWPDEGDTEDTRTRFLDDARKSRQRAPRSVPQEKRVARDDVPFQVGDAIVGQVAWSNEVGARVTIQGFEEVEGFMPANRAPYALRPSIGERQYLRPYKDRQGCIPAGTVRVFQVVAIPEDISPGGRGPLLAANNIDLQIMWRRLAQIAEINRKMRETVRVEAHGATENGLLVQLTGIRGFVPVNHIPRKNDEDWISREDLVERYVGKEVEVSLMDVSVARRSFTASVVNAASDRVLRQLRIGSLVNGTVTRIEAYGVFLSVDDTFQTALLHVTNMSWRRVEHVGDLFRVGDRVRAVVCGMDEGFQRVAVSTRDIEGEEGDMLRDKEGVFRDADKNVERFREHVRRWEAGEARKAAEKGSGEREAAVA